MDARQGSNGRDGNFNRNPSDSDVPDIPGIMSARSDESARSTDPRLMAVPMGASGPELIGAEVPQQPGASVATATSSELGAPWTDTAPSGDGPVRCKFLRTIGPDGKLSDPGSEAVATHRCAAFGDPLPLSLRQQELVCLQRVHVSCPRYMRGTLLAEEASAGAATEPKAKLGIPYLTIAGLALLTLAILIGIAGAMGILPGVNNGSAPTPPPIAVASPSPTIATTPVATASSVATNTPAPSPVPTATPGPTITPVPVATWPPGATASRMKLLTPCQAQANCYVYVVRGPGPSGNGSPVADTVAGIANYFGVSVQSIYNLNPWATAGIKPGDQLKIPPPTR